MKIYNETMTEIIEKPDLKKGYLVNNKILTEKEIPEKNHFEEIKHKNGGISRVKIVDEPLVPAKYEDVQVYILFTDEEIKQNRIIEIQTRLDNLDKDFRQADLGAVFEDLEERKAEFRELHNELRNLQGKPVRQYEV